MAPLFAMLAFMCAAGFFMQKSSTMTFTRILFGVGFGFFGWAAWLATQIAQPGK